MKIAVVTDTGSNMLNEGIHVDGVFCLPLQITDGDNTYLESQTITIQETYQLVKEEHLLKTSLPPLGMIEELFVSLKEQGYEGILAVPICNGLSGTISAMNTIAGQLDMPLMAVDCYSTAHVELTLALSGRKMLDEGYSLEEVHAVLQKAALDSCTYIVPNDLNHLSRGGRLTKSAAMLAGLLKIKPVLYLNDQTEGRIDTFSKVRTMQKALKSIIEEFKKVGIDETYSFCVAHVCDAVTANTFAEDLRKEFPGSFVKVVDLISVVGVHTGIGCIGVQYIKEPRW